MKNLTNVFLVLLFLLFSGCSKNQNKIKIGFLIHSTSNIRWQMDLDYLNERALQLDVDFIVKDAGGNENVQLMQAVELLDEGVDALMVVAANQNTAAGIVRASHKKNVPVIAYDRLINNSDVDYMVSFEYEEIGRQMVDYIGSRISKGNCIMLWGDYGDSNALRIKNGIESAINDNQAFKNIEIVYKAYVPSWSYENAYKIVEKILDFYPEKIDAVIACNVPLALAAADAFRNYGYLPGDVIITAQDATIDFVKAMVNNEVSMTFSKPMQEFAYGSMDNVVDLLKNKKDDSFDKVIYNGRKNVPSKLYSPILIDRSNYKKHLIEAGLFTLDEIH